MSGYVCKKCGGPAPLGVGYPSTVPGASRASESLTACQCGHSRTPVERSPGQRPAWCPHDQPEQAHSRDGARMFITWVRQCSPRNVPWGVDLIDEDVFTSDGVETTGTRVQVYGPERPLTLDEAEQFALHLIDAVKTAQQRP